MQLTSAKCSMLKNVQTLTSTRQMCLFYFLTPWKACQLTSNVYPCSNMGEEFRDILILQPFLSGLQDKSHICSVLYTEGFC